MPFEDQTSENRTGANTSSPTNTDSGGLDVGAVMKEGWTRLAGVQFTYLKVMAVGIVCLIVINWILSKALISTPTDPMEIFTRGGGSRFGFGMIAYNIVSQAFQLVFIGGLYSIAIRHVNNLPTSPANAIAAASKIVPLLIASLAVSVSLLIGFALLIIPGVYLMVSYAFVIPLVLDRNLGVWEAMETSRKTVTKEWFTYFFLFIVVGVACLVAALPILIGLIWVGPWALNVFGILYRNKFGIQDVKNF